MPSQTELLVDLGLEDSIIGITKFCVHPKNLRKEKEIVGGTKQVHIDKIKALNPEIILCNKEENTKAMIAELESISPIHISDINSINDAFELINVYGEIFKVEDKALGIITNIKAERKVFKNYIQVEKPLKAAYFIWKKPWMVAASNTFINAMLNEAGFENVFQNETRYPEVELNHPKLKEAEAILLSSEPYPFKQKHVSELKEKFLNQKVVIVDGELFSWYGSRLRKSFEYFIWLREDLK